MMRGRDLFLEEKRPSPAPPSQKERHKRAFSVFKKSAREGQLLRCPKKTAWHFAMLFFFDRGHSSRSLHPAPRAVAFVPFFKKLLSRFSFLSLPLHSYQGGKGGGEGCDEGINFGFGILVAKADTQRAFDCLGREPEGEECAAEVPVV